MAQRRRRTRIFTWVKPWHRRARGGGAPDPDPVDPLASLTGLVAAVMPAAGVADGGLWQDAGKTTPATADGHPVRVAVCPYTGAEWVAPSDAARPTLTAEGGGKWSLVFDGADDELKVTTAAVNAQPVFVAIASRQPFSGFAGRTPFGGGNNRCTLIEWSGWAMAAGAIEDVIAGASWNNTWGTARFLYSGASSTAALDGASAAPAGSPGTSGAAGFFTVGGNGEQGGYIAVRVAGFLLLAAVPSSGEAATIDNSLTALRP